VRTFGATPEQSDASKGVDYLNSYINSIDDKTNSSLSDAYYYLGLIEKNRNNKQLALSHFNQAIKITPNHRWAKGVIDELK